MSPYNRNNTNNILSIYIITISVIMLCLLLYIVNKTYNIYQRHSFTPEHRYYLRSNQNYLGY